MNKPVKFILITVNIAALILALILLLSPFISLLLPEKYTNRTYYRLLYRVIVDKETSICAADEEKALKLFQYVVDHEFHQGVPYKCKPAESLIYGEAYCDFKARTLNSLLGIARIPSRYAMLIANDNPELSCHTLNEVFLKNKWCVFDTSINIIFKDARGNYLSLEDMSRDFNLISNEKKFAALKAFNKGAYDSFDTWFHRMFPIIHQPQRSTPTMYQEHIFDHIADTYFKVFKYHFFNGYQDVYLKAKKRYAGQKDFRIFFMARNYHLSYRYALALKYYNILLKTYPDSKYTQDAVFFCGMLYFDIKDYRRSIDYFKLCTDKYSKWGNAAYYYLGMVYESMGDRDSAFKAYANTNEFVLPANIIEGLKSKNNKSQKNY